MNTDNIDWNGCDLSELDLRGPYDFCRADLRRADLSGASLSGANLSGARLDAFYLDIPVTISDVRDVILSRRERLKMNSWHSDDQWHNGHAKPVGECGTSHCIAGWAHHLAALRRPELIDPKINVWLVGRLALGEEAASHFYDSNDDALKWLEGLR